MGMLTILLLLSAPLVLADALDSSNEEKAISWIDPSSDETHVSLHDRSNEEEYMSHRDDEKRFMEELMSNLPSSTYSREEVEDDVDDNDEDDDWMASPPQKPLRPSTQPIFPSSPKPCPTGWHAHGPKCYVYVPFKTTWPDAERNCLILGGNLASVHGPHQYRFLLSVIEKSGKKDQRTWVGANDAIQEGLWLWSDGSRFKYHNWSEGQPSNYKGQEHCMEMNYGADRGQNDAPCWYEFAFLCARKL
ncbi:galactose-specific lectin nattectin-like [Esox lucius]|uniref:galactose-specific lectin nattectin-like n=1 Tax=Esox lucius TaxID=8010 RepID=UPI001477656A|nr:galactose-specific lectin nattectin-like [Esox lucius]